MANLNLKNIYKVYPNGTKAVNDFSLDIEDKEFIVFVGPSGCGKSTVLRMIAGLEEISAGELKIDDVVVNDVDCKLRDTAMVFQNYALYPHMTVADNMAFPIKMSRLTKQQKVDLLIVKGENSMKFKGVIFDLDGVLVHTDEFHYLSWKSLADELRVYFDRTINNRLRGVSRMDSLEIVLEKSAVKYTDEDKARLAAIKNERYVKLLDGMSEQSVDEGVIKTLNKLKAMGLKLAIGSSSKNTKLILQKTGLNKFFDAVSDGTNITKSKPDPEVFVKAAAFIGEQPCDCVVVEDAYSGIDAAKDGGFTAVAIGDATKYSRADYAIATLDELVGIVK